MTGAGIEYPEQWKEDQPGSSHLDSSPGTAGRNMTLSKLLSSLGSRVL